MDSTGFYGGFCVKNIWVHVLIRCLNNTYNENINKKQILINLIRLLKYVSEGDIEKISILKISSVVLLKL